MGEYAKYNGERIKIGTCESMYYLRADQAHLVTAEPGNVDPVRDGQSGAIRFRFPFPDEDQIGPGCFEEYNRGEKIPGWTLPESFGDHGQVQFTAPQGYNLCVPCPEGPAQIEDLTIHRNGWNGGPRVQQQRHYEGNLVTVVACGACGGLWRLETLSDAEPVIVAFRSEADRLEVKRLEDDQADYRHTEKTRRFLHAIADRIAAGYDDGATDAWLSDPDLHALDPLCRQIGR